MKHRMCATLVCILLSLWGVRDAGSAEQDSAYLSHPRLLLIRDSGIRRELQLRPAQIEAIDRLLDDWNERLLALRILSVEKDAEKIRQVISELESALNEQLDARQQARLRGLELQAIGWGSLLRPELADELQLSEAQRTRIAAILKETQSEARKLQESSREPAAAERGLARLRTEQRDRIAAVFTQQQKKAWLDLVGPAYELSRVRQVIAKAPELRGVTEWINGGPVVLAEMRGRVVVLHFFAADCINCIRNMPHYRKWDAQFSDSEVAIVGIHTPETKREREIEHVRQKVQEYELKFPVAIDNDGQNWNAWTNRIWPSVYVIDKQGNIRHWWYGELEWQGAGGEKWMRERIQALLAEAN